MTPNIPKEDWSLSGFYQTFHYKNILIRSVGLEELERPNGKVPPFFDYYPLSEEEHEKFWKFFWECRDMVVNQELSRLSIELQKPEAQSQTVRHNFCPLDPPHELVKDFPRATTKHLWDCHAAVLCLYFAETAKAQANAKQELSKLSQRGPVALRKLLSEINKSTRGEFQRKSHIAGEGFYLQRIPVPIRERISWQPRLKDEFGEWTGLIPYYFSRAFIWRFLHEEASTDTGTPRYRRRPTWLSEIAEELADHYSELGLTTRQIANGLADPNQAIQDTAQRFQLEPTTVRKHLQTFSISLSLYSSRPT